MRVSMRCSAATMRAGGPILAASLLEPGFTGGRTPCRTDRVEVLARHGMVESILLSVSRVSTFLGSTPLTTASGFFFEREGRHFLVTSRHVLSDPASSHLPDRLEITLHVDPRDLTRIAVVSLDPYQHGRARWRQARDSGGEVDVAAFPIDSDRLPPHRVVRSFTPANLEQSLEELEVGAAVHIVGFPLGFYDTVHHLPVVRQATIASSFGVRFQGEGYFLTDARTHRGMSGAPVVARANASTGLPWKLLGIHSSRLDMLNRDNALDDPLGLNVAWYADILGVLTN
jgi:S1-C subfamily serine protease